MIRIIVLSENFGRVLCIQVEYYLPLVLEQVSDPWLFPIPQDYQHIGINYSLVC